jgi:hypothetical protein
MQMKPFRTFCSKKRLRENKMAGNFLKTKFSYFSQPKLTEIS